jgi:formylglycine-generating enzyme required for sulfatase activity
MIHRRVLRSCKSCVLTPAALALVLAAAAGEKPAKPAGEGGAPAGPDPAAKEGPRDGAKPAWTVYDGWPFDAKEAERRQKETAEKTGLPAEKSVDLGDGLKIELVLVPAGEFDMGSPESERGLPSDRDEAPVHRVRITKPFYMGKHEVTQEIWEKAAGNNPSRFKGARNPVESVSWNEVQQFLKKLSAKLEGQAVLGLPSEAQWEYACRAGTSTPFNFGADVEKDMKDFAWFEWNSEGRSHPVGGRKPNAWGLYDMHGSVWEWCADAYDFKYYARSPKDDPAGPAEGKLRCVRGGAWYNGPGSCRSANRYGFDPRLGSPLYGLRLAMEAAPAGKAAAETK